MAQVAYNSGVPEVAPETRVANDYQRIETPANAFGAATAQGLEKLGAGATKAGEFFGQVAADDASNNLHDKWTKRLYGDPNASVPGPDGKPQPDLGYMGLKGRAALDARPDLEAAMDQDLKEIRAGLTTPRQQLEFNNFSRRYRSYSSSEVGRHADTQANTWYGDVASKEYALNKDHVVRNADNPQEVAAGAAGMMSAAAKRAELRGATKGDELWNASVQEARKDAFKLQVETIGATDPARAMRMLEKNRDLAGASYIPLAHQFRSGAAQVDGRVLADEITGHDAGAPTLDKVTAYERVIERTKDDPLLQSAAIARLNQIYSIYAAQRVAGNAAFDTKLHDTVAEAQATGSVVNPLTETQFAERYRDQGDAHGAATYQEYVREIQSAGTVHAIRGMSEKDQAVILERAQPKEGPGFAAAQERYGRLVKEVARVNKQRREDPAATVADDPAVREAQAAIDPKKPETFQRFVATRLAAQEHLGIPFTEQSPLTLAEAGKYVTVLHRGAASIDTAKAAQSFVESINRDFGPQLAPLAFNTIMQRFKIEKDTSALLYGMLKKQNMGLPVTDQDFESLRNSIDTANWSRATEIPDRVSPTTVPGAPTSSPPAQTGSPVVPSTSGAPGATKRFVPGEVFINPDDITSLRTGKLLPADFDKLYGSKAAETVMKLRLGQ